ncbi:MAG: hypothetical protein ACE368_16310 [Paracoccaceae bacterium]
MNMKIGGGQNIPGQGMGLDQTEGPRGKREAGGGIGGLGGQGNIPEAGGFSGARGAGGTEGGFSVQNEANPPETAKAEANLQQALESGDSAKIAQSIADFLAEIGGDDVLAKLMIEFAAMGRQQALDARLQARENARSQLMGQAEETRQAADKALAGAIIAGVISIVASVVSIARRRLRRGWARQGNGRVANQADTASAAASQASSFSKGAEGATKTAAKEMSDLYKQTANSANTSLQTLQAGAQGTQMLVQGVSGLVNALAQMIKGGLDAGAGLDEPPER